MRKINKLIRTKAKFQYYHKKLWNEIIRLLKTEEDSCYAFATKRTAFNNLFHPYAKVAAYCFGCEWAVAKNKGEAFGKMDCLFKVSCKDCDENKCLRGWWYKFEDTPTIKRAEKIRDFPVK